MQFRDTVGDLEAGVQVLFRGMPMGSVKEVRITFDAAAAHFDIPVTIELDPRPFVAGEPSQADAAKVYEAIGALVRTGLRAELVQANLFPGGLAVALEMRPDAPPVQSQHADADLPEIPHGRAFRAGDRENGADCGTDRCAAAGRDCGKAQ